MKVHRKVDMNTLISQAREIQWEKLIDADTDHDDKTINAAFTRSQCERTCMISCDAMVVKSVKMSAHAVPRYAMMKCSTHPNCACKLLWRAVPQ